MEREKLIATVLAAQKGDEEALNTLFNSFYKSVYYFVRKTVRDEYLAYDITQETFIEVIQTIGKLREPAAFVTWTKRIAYHRCTPYFEKRQNKKEEVVVDEDEDGYSVFDKMAIDDAEVIPDEVMERKDFREIVLALLDSLPEEQRSALVLYYYDEMSVKQIAEIQNAPEGTVKSRLNYGRKALKETVEEYEKKNGIKLHSVAVLPLLLWLLAEGSKDAVPGAATMASGITAATGVTVTATAGAAGGASAVAAGTGLAAKLAALPLFAKVTAGVVAATVVAGGVGAAVVSAKPELPVASTGVTCSSSLQQTTAPQMTPATTAVAPTVHPGTTATPRPQSEPVPEGCSYIVFGGATLQAGDPLPETAQWGDTFVTEDYEYYMNLSAGGWTLSVRDGNKVEYEPLLGEFLGKQLREVRFTSCGNMRTAPVIPEGVRKIDFWGCAAMTEVPSLPTTLTTLNNAFTGCVSLISVPDLPEGLEDISYAFSGCASLKNAPRIPDSVTGMERAFQNCSALESVPGIPAGVTNLNHTFSGCTSLKTTPTLPVGITKLDGTFRNCTALETAVLPDGVQELNDTFFGCSMLKVAPVIPESVVKMSGTFSWCTALTDAPAIPAGVKDLSSAFATCISLTNGPVIPAGVENMYQTFYFCNRLTGTLQIHANPTEYTGCFGLTQQPIVLTGSSTLLTELAATGSANITAQP